VENFFFGVGILAWGKRRVKKDMIEMNVVWFKRDLRVIDHRGLANGQVLPLYIFEPELWQEPDLSARHYRFLHESLCELDEALRGLGHALVIRVGDAVEVLQALKQEIPIQALWSHQETWNHWTYQRDLRVKKWALYHGIPWHEPVQNGVVRAKEKTSWFEEMNQPLAKPVPLGSSFVPLFSEGLPKPKFDEGQKGGRKAGLALLSDFLESRGEGYSYSLSSPVTAFRSCSRLSAHLAFGTVSIREVVQAAALKLQRAKQEGLKAWTRSMAAFLNRLRWHCHFIQKLERNPSLEYRCVHPDYQVLRPETTPHFEVFKEGKTGYPMIDACMRALAKTGYLNFRMRAMVMSFVSYHLWSDWKEPALYLARQFTDYEPGIHYSQVQMQSGTSGINALRIYNPIKQGLDQDPQGLFIRQWVPELEKMPQPFLHTPWQCPEHLQGYPLPVVEEESARKSAAKKLYDLRKTMAHRSQVHVILKSIKPHRKYQKRKKKNHQQLELPL